MSQVTLLTGAVGGFVGAIAMVVVMQALGDDDPPPFAVFWAEYLGDGDPASAMPQSLLLHAIYAVVAGGVYVPVFTAFDLGIPITGFGGGAIWGIVWGLVLFAVAAVFWVNNVLDMDPTGRQVRTMAMAHLAYGLTLGLLSAAVPHLG